MQRPSILQLGIRHKPNSFDKRACAEWGGFEAGFQLRDRYSDRIGVLRHHCATSYLSDKEVRKEAVVREAEDRQALREEREDDEPLRRQ